MLHRVARHAAKCVAGVLLALTVLFVVASSCDRGVPRQAGPDALSRVSALEGDIRALQGMGARTTPEQQWRAARWIAARFEDAGVATTIRSYEDAGRSWPNVVATIPGPNASNDVVMVTAHLDSVARDSQAAPGADDNASGVAIAIQVARDLAHTELHRPVVFAVFSNEERGAVGSRNYARAARTRGARIRATINVDVVGYNRPRVLGLFDAMGAHESARYKLKAAWRAVRNYTIALRDGQDVLTVAGHEGNRELVEHVAAAMLVVPGLRVRPIVSNACG